MPSLHWVKDYCGPLSIKTVRKGRVAWRIDRHEIWIDPSSYLVLNHREPYSMEIDEPEPVETLVVFFEPGFVEDAFRTLATPEDCRLDNPVPNGQQLLFLSRLRPRNEMLARAMRRIQAQLQNLPFKGRAASLGFEESYLDLAAELVSASEETRKHLGKVPAARASTRAELLMRISRGREYIHAAFGRAVTLAEVARAAGMSPFHFQRTFKRVFGVSPARYTAGLCLARAAEMLKAGRSVTDAALESGFGGTAAFSIAFQRWCGQPPSRFAAGFRKNSKAPSA